MTLVPDEEMQSHFADALLDREQAVPEGLTAWTGGHPGRRFEVYRNNVMAGLVRALESRFPAAERIVGNDFFAGMARRFIGLHPPRSPLLLTYGDELADFVAGFASAANVPYLADVIRLEAARGKAHHAADTPALDPAALAVVPADRLPGLRFTLHPSVSVLRSVHPVVTIWAMNAGEAPLGPIERWVGEDALVVRSGLTVLVRCLPEAGATLLDALAADASLGGAVEAAVAEAPDIDLAATLAGVLQAGVLTAFR